MKHIIFDKMRSQFNKQVIGDNVIRDYLVPYFLEFEGDVPGISLDEKVGVFLSTWVSIVFSGTVKDALGVDADRYRDIIQEDGDLDDYITKIYGQPIESIEWIPNEAYDDQDETFLVYLG